MIRMETNQLELIAATEELVQAEITKPCITL